MARPIDPNLKIQLLAAAETEFARRGLADTRIDDIVKRAGRSKGSFYQYFDSKEAVFAQISESLLARLESIVGTTLVDEQRGWTVEQFLAAWRARDEAIFEFVWANRALVRMILVADFSARMSLFTARTHTIVVDSLCWARENKIYRRDFDLETISMAITGGYDRLARVIVASETKPNLRKIVHDLQRFVLHGILNDRPGK